MFAKIEYIETIFKDLYTSVKFLGFFINGYKVIYNIDLSTNFKYIKI